MSTVTFQQQEPATEPQTTQPRKRRRRTAGGGAQDDCFACRRRGVPCDRKRPYCTQCIDIGKECSGYKTTLTWGVGVASRGKLRGLSLPIASKQNGDGAGKTSNAQTQQTPARRKSSVSKVNTKPSSRDVNNSRRLTSLHTSAAPSAVHTSAAPSAASTAAVPAAAVPTAAIPIPRAQSQRFSATSYSASEIQPLGSWQMDDMSAYSVTSPTPFKQFDHSSMPSLKHVQDSLGSRFDNFNFPSSASSTGSFAEADLHTPIDLPTSSTMPYSSHFSSSFPAYLSSPTAPTSSATIDMNSTSLDASLAMLGHYGDLTSGLYAGQEQEFESSLADINEDDLMAESRTLPLVDSRFSNPLFHLPSRIQSLISYYDTNICPFLVAFDGPQNPYRMHIIQLASQNQGLQNALAALATNNMRMRRKEERQVGFVKEFIQSPRFNSPDASEPTPEEAHYKQLSIELLNAQLVHPSAAQDDSVLATLLILCLFHVCDSGFSKFKTQLAGVQKLLSLRSPNTSSPFTRWVEMFFMWFDVMTSAVNDREPQIKGEALDMLDYTVNLGALEQFSGCDGKLFKLIARLGGLSLLAQGRPATVTPVRAALSPTSMVRSMRRRRPMIKAVLNRSLDVADYEQLDGNGWGSPIVTSDEDADGELDGAYSTHDQQETFWTEWRDIRVRLEEWEMDPIFAAADDAYNLHGNNLTPEQKDLVHISESFRHSALLYTERLAHPLLPSSASEFQNHVSKALYHITALPVTSCVNKFLLWPLFITGTECVDAGHRAVVRTRCIEIQRESGFFNNISCLEVLEKVWGDVGMGYGDESEIHARRRDSEVSAGGESRQAFRWRRAMDRVNGEYLII